MKLIEMDEFKSLVSERCTIVDARKPEMFSDGFIKYAVSIPFNENFIASFQELIENNQHVLIVANEADVPSISKKLSSAGIQNVNGVDKNFQATDRFHFVQMGVGVSIFKKGEKARIEAAKINRQIAETEATFQSRQIEGQIAEARQQLLKHEAALDFYERTAFPMANLIFRQAQSGYRAGEIGYVAYLQALRQVRETAIGQLDALKNFNQTMILLEFLCGL